MFILYDTNHDQTNWEVTDLPLAVNSCGMNTSPTGQGGKDSLYVRRPQGRRDYQLLYVAKGCARHMLAQGWRDVHAGEAVLYRPGEAQFYSYEAEVPTLCQWVHFSGSCAKALLESCGFGEGAVFAVGEDREIRHLFTQMIQEYQLEQPFHEQIRAGLLQQIIALMGRDRRVLSDRVSYQTRKKLQEVVAHMNYHFAEPQSVGQYAQQCGMDRYHFIHTFKESVGQSPYAFLTALRLQKASELLSGSTMPIKAVAANCGYDNPLYFSRAFSKHFGMPPTEYRKKHSAIPNS